MAIGSRQLRCVLESGGERDALLLCRYRLVTVMFERDFYERGTDIWSVKLILMDDCKVLGSFAFSFDIPDIAHGLRSD